QETHACNAAFRGLLEAVVVAVDVHIAGELRGLEFAEVVLHIVPAGDQGWECQFIGGAAADDGEDIVQRVLAVHVSGGLRFGHDVRTWTQTGKLVEAVGARGGGDGGNGPKVVTAGEGQRGADDGSFACVLDAIVVCIHV